MIDEEGQGEGGWLRGWGEGWGGGGPEKEEKHFHLDFRNETQGQWTYDKKETTRNKKKTQRNDTHNEINNT